MEAVATTGAHSLSIVNKQLPFMLKDEVKIAFDNATGNEIFSRKYKVEKFEKRLWCIVKECPMGYKDMKGLQVHCLCIHDISFSIRGEFILNIQLKQRKIGVFDMSGKDARNITNLPESGSISNDCVKVEGIIGESSSPIADNDLRYILKDEVINDFENYKGDNHYGGKYKISIVDNKYECIRKRCNRSYKGTSSLNKHCLFNHNIRIMLRDEDIISIEKVQDNTSATKTTTDNMDSNRKRSYATSIHEEESNAKKAMLNSSESGYPQSDPASENIDDKEILELARELAENNSDFQYALNKDVADQYATSRDSYLQFSITTKKV